MQKAFYADAINGCQAISTTDAYDFPVMHSDDPLEVIADLHTLQTPTAYIVSAEVYAEVDKTFGIR
jgi:hypothetical protein